MERIGLSQPAAKRLLDAVKKKKSSIWRKSLVSKIFPSMIHQPGIGSPNKSPKDIVDEYINEKSDRATWLIQEKASCLILWINSMNKVNQVQIFYRYLCIE